MPQPTIAIGDIHGCDRTLRALWEKIRNHDDATFVFLGDYIDRGPSSAQVVEFLIEIEKQASCIFLLGNHEQMLLKALEGENMNRWLHFGGAETLESYGTSLDELTLPEHHLAFFKRCVPYYQNEHYFFAHAGAPPHMTLSEAVRNTEHADYFLWGNEHLSAPELPWEKTVVFGHTHRAYPILKPKLIGIDTGCVYDEPGYGKLTAVLLPEERFIQQVRLD
ncbi:MAG: metallophosphoesterase family protein [Balneolaceae bacterium]